MDHEQRFHFEDGGSVGSLEELRDRLEGISYQEFYNHVNAEKNDFANWVRGVLQNEELATDMEKVTSIVETVEIMNDSINPLQGPHDDIQSKIEEEALDMHVETVPTTEPVVEHSEEVADLDVIQEQVEEPQPDEQPEELPEIQHEPEATPEQKPEEHVLSQQDYTRLIVKDFMYGLIFGLIIGVILGRILSF